MASSLLNLKHYGYYLWSWFTVQFEILTFCTFVCTAFQFLLACNTKSLNLSSREKSAHKGSLLSLKRLIYLLYVIWTHRSQRPKSPCSLTWHASKLYTNYKVHKLPQTQRMTSSGIVVSTPFRIQHFIRQIFFFRPRALVSCVNNEQQESVSRRKTSHEDNNKNLVCWFCTGALGHILFQIIQRNLFTM